jgi:hypothetical protein
MQHQLNTHARYLLDTLRSALQVSARRSSEKAQGYNWWNEPCQTAAKVYRAARRHAQDALEAGLPGDREMELAASAQKDLCRIVRGAKRQFYRDKIQAATQGKDIISMTQWATSVGSSACLLCTTATATALLLLKEKFSCYEPHTCQQTAQPLTSTHQNWSLTSPYGRRSVLSKRIMPFPAQKALPLAKIRSLSEQSS